MKNMSISVDIAKSWQQFLGEGKAFNTFEVKEDGPDKLWVKGDTVKVGLQLDVTGKPEFYATNLTQNRQLVVTPERPEIENEFGFKKCFFPHRLLRGSPPIYELGCQEKEPSSDLSMCNYKCQDPAHRFSLYLQEPFCVLKLSTGRIWALYYNFAPLEEKGHLIWVPATFSGKTFELPHLPQVMTRELLEDTMILARKSIGFLYYFNALHAGATQHHFHSQLIYVGDELLPIERSTIVAIEGYSLLDNYPINGQVFGPDASPDQVWHSIDRFQQNGNPFNLIMVRGRIFLVPRNPDHEIVKEFPFGVLASVEIAGRIIISDRKNFDETTYEKVVSAFKSSGLERSEVIRLIKQ